MKQIIKHVFYITVVHILIYLSMLSSAIFLHSKYFCDHNEQLVDFLSKNACTLKNGPFFSNYNNILIIFDDKTLELKNNHFVFVEKLQNVDKYKITSNTDQRILWPFKIAFKSDDITIVIDFQSNIIYYTTFFILILFIFSLIAYSVYTIIIKNKDREIHNIEVIARDNALSERTTNYLVSIMNHKINTPLKIISVKSRALISCLEASTNLTEELKDKIINDYVKLQEAVNYMFELTDKIKKYKESTKAETNIYNLVTIAKETLDILTDDDFEITINYNLKLYNIENYAINNHEFIQVILNQLKLSLHSLADQIDIKVIKNKNSNDLILIYSDNGNQLDNEFQKFIKRKISLKDLQNGKYSDVLTDTVLSVDILESVNGSLKLIKESTGNKFELRIPSIN